MLQGKMNLKETIMGYYRHHQETCTQYGGYYIIKFTSSVFTSNITLNKQTLQSGTRIFMVILIINVANINF